MPYTSGTTDVAVRTNESGTAKLRFLFVAPRGPSATTWPDDKGFLGKTTDDSTGLTHVGAREYDPTTGRFLSVDPLLEVDTDQSLNGYSYADNNPVRLSDPSGISGLACGGYGDDTPCPKDENGNPTQHPHSTAADEGDGGVEGLVEISKTESPCGGGACLAGG